jgi:nicotinamidase/pyrazinamidase
MTMRIKLDQSADMLGLIDIQPSFMPGGELPVAEGDAVVAVANRLSGRVFDHAFATQDWHPSGHSSFASAHPGRSPYDTIEMLYGPQTLWPDHCVQGTAGAAFHPALELDRIEIIVRKGFRPAIDSYSAFFENDRKTPTGLAGYLRERGFRRLFVMGLATDFCVAYSAADALALGFEVMIIEEGCRGIGLPLREGGTTIDAARRSLAEHGARFIRMDALEGSS